MNKRIVLILSAVSLALSAGAEYFNGSNNLQEQTEFARATRGVLVYHPGMESVSYVRRATSPYYIKNPELLLKLNTDFTNPQNIDAAVSKISEYIKGIKSKASRTFFKGFTFDFTKKGMMNFATCSQEQKIAYLNYLKALRACAKSIDKNAKFIFEVGDIYKEWVEPALKVENLKSDYAEALPDMVLTRNPGTAFVDDARIFDSGLLTKEQVGTATLANRLDIPSEVRDISKAATAGAWGLIDEAGEDAATDRMCNVPPRLSMTRILPSFENMNKTPLSKRHYDEKTNTYSSPTAFMSEGGVCLKFPGGDYCFVVFTAPGGKIKLPDGYTGETFESMTGSFKSMLVHHGRRPIKFKMDKDGRKLFNFVHWMSKTKPLIFSEKDGYLRLGGAEFTNEPFLLRLKKKN